ncbi:hypothetical protein [Spirosoma sordidisoli]|uniref:Uncharacterized protein n=1 Tax=Spirosoma sordidisoli TaxID=2502893 RepID=A0A4Q2UGK5_9BACT|nr:hypothetical protein [Spirosoma sordidisoli]RYC68274.1 hypothetical protein EQG79_18075 [Spirosoma sordidisoli]
MPATTNYSTFTADELLAENAKIKKQRLFWAFVLGAFLGVLFWAAISGASLIKLLVLFVAFGILGSGGKKNEDNYKAIQAELSSRNIQP